MATLDTTALAAVLKTQYTQSKVNNLCYPESPLFAKIKKRTDFVGANKVVAFQYGSPQGRGIDFTTGLANVATSLYSKVTVTRARDYAFGQVSGEAVEAAGTDAGALLIALKREIDNAMYTASRSIATQLFRNGGGARGQISAASNTGTATVTLTNLNDIVNFEKGMVLNTSTADGTSGAKKAGTVTVLAVDRDAGTITATGNWTAGIATAAANDYIFQNGDFESTNSAMMGLAGWIPATAPVAGVDSFFGLDRGVDPVRLAGLRYTDNAGGPIEETLIKCAFRMAREGASPDFAVMNPMDVGNLVVALGSKVIYNRVQSSDEPDIGFKSVQLIGPKGPIDIVSDLNCPSGKGWMLTTKTWSFETLKGAPRILNLDGNDMRASATADSYIFRIGYYGNLICEAPGWNAYFTL
jgi:hypothetical protein